VRVLETPSFRKDVKRLQPNQKQDLDGAVRAIMADPMAGDQKQGDLAWLRVYKFRMVNQLTLLGYELTSADTLVLHAVGSHENFYRDLKAN
jgi:mRNA-degrading endonuclease YafQ of YafQ-DinJ toxin-antitoxin module